MLYSIYSIDVYTQLQQLGVEKWFGSVSIVGEHSFSKPEELQERLSFYHAITLQSLYTAINRSVATFYEDKVNSIELGGGMLEEIDKWP